MAVLRDPHTEGDSRLGKGSKLVGLGYLVVLLGIFLPLCGLAFNSSKLVFGVPISLLWIFVCLAGFPALALVGYTKVFKPWAEAVDGEEGEQE